MWYLACYVDEENMMDVYTNCLLHAHSDRTFRATISSQLEPYQITMMEWLLLGVVAASPSRTASMSDIAVALKVTLPQVTALAAKLSPLKLIQQGAARVDKRTKLVQLTPNGQKVLEASNAAMEITYAAMFKGLSSDDVQSYHRVSQQLANHSLV